MAISETEALPESKLGRMPVDMSLRLWSSDVPLGFVAGQTGLATNHLHVRGQPIRVGESLTNRIAARHYASIANAKGLNSQDVSTWLTQLARALESHGNIVHLIQTGRIEALAWIASFDRSLSLGPLGVISLKKLMIGVMIEDYTRWDSDGAPLRVIL